MSETLRKTLAVIGAGPKGLAIAIKAKVLEEFNVPVNKVVLIEKSSVAANWSGEWGYTDGELKLGTPPEKDVVFPIETDVGAEDLNEKIRLRLLDFSWTAFLIQTKTFSDWVDRGRPSPCHLRWAQYLTWVSSHLEPQVKILKGEVKCADIDTNTNQWQLSLVNGKETFDFTADHLVLTGPGKTKINFNGGSHILPAHTYTLETFWNSFKRKTFKPRGRVAIVGAGETTAAVLLALGKTFPDMLVDVIAPRGYLTTRSENYYENQFYSQPDRHGWSHLNSSDRRDFIDRTDLGVFSVHAMNILNEQIRHTIVPGRMTQLASEGQTLKMTVEYNGQTSTRIYDQLILANGSDHVSTLKSLLSSAAQKKLELALEQPITTEALSQRIRRDLSLEGLMPSLHLPMLAGVAQGPGFANLSCLGRLSDRILVEASL